MSQSYNNNDCQGNSRALNYFVLKRKILRVLFIYRSNFLLTLLCDKLKWMYVIIIKKMNITPQNCSSWATWFKMNKYKVLLTLSYIILFFIFFFSAIIFSLNSDRSLHIIFIHIFLATASPVWLKCMTRCFNLPVNC